MKKFMLPALMLSLMVCVFSCKKDSDPTTGKSKTELLTQAGWKPTNYETGVGGSGVYTSQWASLFSCKKDDVTTFKADKTYETIEGATKCDPSDPDVFDSGIWSISVDEKILIINGDPNTIVTLNSTTLVVTSTFSGIDYRDSYSH